MHIQMVHGHVGPDVADLLLSGTPHFLDVVKVLFDGGPVGESFENLRHAGLQLSAELLGAHKTDAGILDDLWQWAVTHGENGLFLMPESLARKMVQLTIPDEDLPAEESPQLINEQVVTDIGAFLVQGLRTGRVPQIADTGRASRSVGAATSRTRNHF